jgi:hypothetical protein
VSSVSDLESQVQEVLDASVAFVLPPFDVIQAVRRRHRRRLVRAATASVTVVAALGAAAALSGLPGWSGPAASRGNSNASHPAPVFPGGGRLLFADSGGLKWLYPDGKAVRIASGFSMAEVHGSELVAWNSTGVYTMALDGSRQQQALAFTTGSGAGVPQSGALSPGGSRIAYYIGKKLWAADLATGRRVQLGRVSFDGWRNNTTILASANDRSALLLVNAATGNRSAYLSITDPALVRAYRNTWPHAGRLAGLASEGFSASGTSAALAITLAARGPFGGARPAEVIMTGAGRLVTYAPATPQQFEFSWGPHGLFRIETGAGDNPGSWNAYIGAVQSDRLSAPITYGADGAAFNPAGTLIALQDSNQVTFLPTPQPACQSAACLHFQLKYLVNQGKLITWAP